MAVAREGRIGAGGVCRDGRPADARRIGRDRPLAEDAGAHPRTVAGHVADPGAESITGTGTI
jgi:hypothetical protein